MRFERVELENWGPYRGPHSIDVRATPHSPIVLIFGENGKGKTSFAKAIVWCLFGNESKVDGRQFANWAKVRDEAEFPVQVKIVFSVDLTDGSAESDVEGATTETSTFELIRGFRAKRDHRTKYSVKSDDEYLSLRRNGGEPEDQRLVDVWINQYIPIEMSRFFLFDGEELNDIKRDLEEGTSTTIKKSIESVMGIPRLDDLDSLIRAELKKIDAAFQAGAKHKADQDNVKRLVAGVEALQLEKRKTEINIEIGERKIAALTAEIAHYQDAHTKVRLHATQKEQLRSLEAEIAAVQDDIKACMTDSWWAPLAKRIAALQQAESEERRLEGDRERLVRQIRALRESLDTGSCMTCGQQLADHESIDAQILELEDELAEYRKDDESPPTGYIARFPKPESDRLVLTQLLRDERKKLVDAKKLRDSIAAIMSEIDTDEIESSAGLLQQFALEQRQVERLNAVLQDIDVKLDLKRSEERNARKKITAEGGVPEDLEVRNQALAELDAMVDDLQKTFRDLVREKVEEVASVSYVEMMENEDLIGLDISPSFEVLARHRALGSKPASSFGQSLIAVYAFVGALIDVSGHQGAWLIDTIGAQLDEDRMRAVWKWLGNRNRQVIAMPHSGELKKEKAGLFLSGKISCQWEIVNNEQADADSRFLQIGA